MSEVTIINQGGAQVEITTPGANGVTISQNDTSGIVVGANVLGPFNDITIQGSITASGDISASGNLEISSSLTFGNGIAKIIGPGDNDFIQLATDNIDFFINGGEVINIDTDSINLNASNQNIDTTIQADDGTQLFMGDASNNVVRLNDHIIMSPGAPTDYTNRLLVSGSSKFIGNITASGTVVAGDGDLFTSYETASSAGKSHGDIVKFGNFTTLPGVIYAFTGSTWSKAHSGSNGGASSSIAIAIGTNSTTHGMLLRGFTQLPADPGGVNGRALYLGTAGSASITPTGITGHVARVVGYHYGSNQVYFTPDNTWIVK